MIRVDQLTNVDNNINNNGFVSIPAVGLSERRTSVHSEMHVRILQGGSELLCWPSQEAKRKELAAKDRPTGDRSNSTFLPGLGVTLILVTMTTIGRIAALKFLLVQLLLRQRLLLL